MLHNKLKKFINQKNGYFLVIGSPGTGKTYYLVETVKKNAHIIKYAH